MKKFSLALLLAAVGAVWGADFTIGEAVFSTKGASLKSYSWKKNPLLVQGKIDYPSFADKLSCAKGKRAICEDFGALEFEALPFNPKGNSVTFTVRGTKAFNWLRMTKKYTVNPKTGAITLLYTLANSDTKAHSAGFWTKTFLRRDDAGNPQTNTYYQMRNGKLFTFAHPGPGATSDIFSLNPGKALYGVCGTDKTGAIVRLPGKYLDALYTWCSTDKFQSTLEWFLKEIPVPAGKSVSFTVTVTPGNNIPALIAKAALSAEKCVPGLKPNMLAQLYSGKVKDAVAAYTPDPAMPVSAKYLDVKGKRQYCQSVRAARLPADVDVSRVGVYEMANKQEISDRPVPFNIVKLKSGEHQIRFFVPGFSVRGYYYTTFRDGYAFEGKNMVGRDEFSYRICFDRPGKACAANDPRLAGGPDLIYNGDLEIENPQWKWADGQYWCWAARERGCYFWDKKKSFDGSNCFRIKLPKSCRHWGALSFFFRPEPGRRYTASCYAKSDNPDKHWAYIPICFQDAKKKENRKLTVDMIGVRASFDWKKLEKVFFTPEGMEFGAFTFSILQSKSETMWFDKVHIVPEDFAYRMLNPKEALYKELVENRNPNVPILEKLNTSFVTPHEKWLTNPVDPMPEVLYLPLASNRSVQTPFRRAIIEFAQRMKLNYRYIPLLRRVEHVDGGGWRVTFGNKLEKYTMYCLNEIKKAPRVVIVQAINFQKDVQPEFTALLKKFQKQGSNILFYGCQNIPADLLGKKAARPAEIMTVPRVRDIGRGREDRGISFYRQGKNCTFVINAQNEWYWDPSSFACAFEFQLGRTAPSLYSKEYPYYEYIYLSTLKALRYLAGVKPAFQITGSSDGSLTVKAVKAGSATLKCDIYDTNRTIQRSFTQKLNLKQGDNAVAVDRTKLPGGQHIAHCYILNDKKQVYDCGASYFKTAETAKIAVKFAQPKGIFRTPEVKADVTVTNLPANAELEYVVCDIHNRVTIQKKFKAQANNKIEFKVPAPRTLLNRMWLRLYQGSQVVAVKYTEFALPTPKDIYQMDSMLWYGYVISVKLLSDLGFTHAVINMGQNMESMGNLHAHADVGINMISIGAGHVGVPYNSELAYRGDIKSDPVRKPCYSDPAHLAKTRKMIVDRMKMQNYDFYNIALHEIADEAFLGSSVCYSPHCLKGLRERLKKDYGSLDKLNAEWETSFKTWDAVVPCQLTELKDKKNLSRWLDHKMFMVELFARNWVGHTRNSLRLGVPGSKAGLSGTQIPGLSYDWWQLMKHIDCLSFYGGIQRKVVQDFAAPGFVSGQWTGGYIQAYETNEYYEKSTIWENLFLGSNFISNFMGHGINGDLSACDNTKLFCEAVNEMRGGIARMILSAKEIKRDVAILYSQPSLYTAMGTIGANMWHNSQTGWASLVSDLKYSYFYYSYEQLDADAPKAKVLILPCAVALSDKAIDNLVKFVKNGGTIIADFAPGISDEHGKTRRSEKLEKLFGIDRTNAVVIAENLTAPQIKGSARYGERGLASKGAKADFLTPNKTAVLLNNRSGKGNAALLNVLLTGYQAVELGGVGGELNTVKSGSALFCESIREIVDEILKKSGAEHNSVITQVADGKLYPCNSVLKKDGDNYCFGILKSMTSNGTDKYPMLFKDGKRIALQVKLPVSGYIYDVRAGRYVGRGNTFKISYNPGDAQVFSILEDKVSKVKIDAPESVKAGVPFDVEVKAAGGSSAHIFRIEAIAPDGKAPRHYRFDFRAPKAKGTLNFAFALNDAKGKWTLLVTDVNTGIQNRRTIVVR